MQERYQCIRVLTSVSRQKFTCPTKFSASCLPSSQLDQSFVNHDIIFQSSTRKLSSTTRDLHNPALTATNFSFGYSGQFDTNRDRAHKSLTAHEINHAKPSFVFVSRMTRWARSISIDVHKKWIEPQQLGSPRRPTISSHTTSPSHLPRTDGDVNSLEKLSDSGNRKKRAGKMNLSPRGESLGNAAISRVEGSMLFSV